jgi:hypothetical protein
MTDWWNALVSVATTGDGPGRTSVTTSTPRGTSAGRADHLSRRRTGLQGTRTAVRSRR